MRDSKDRLDKKGSSSIKRDLLASLLAREGIELSQIISKRKTSGPAPLSFAQQRLWFLDQLNPGSALYNLPRVVRFVGRLDLDALELVINEVVRRHEVLRTRIEAQDGAPMQVIDAWEHRRLEVVDLTSLTREERGEEVGRRAREEARTGFDLKRGPLLRVKVLKLEKADHVLLYTLHHIVSDEWSTGILIKEVGALYQAYLEGRESPLEEMEIQYADFAAWQRTYLIGEVLEGEVRYWREQLKDADMLELPADRTRPAEPSYRGRVESVALGRPIREGLERLIQQERVTLFMALMAAFKTLLMRYSGQEDVSVGTPIANRTRKELEGLIGFFVNTLVMRTDLSGNPSFRELLRREREVALGAYAHQELPFEKLVEELNPERDLSRNPLFQVMMALENARTERFEIEGLKLRGVGNDSVGEGEIAGGGGTGTAKFDLELELTEAEEGVVGIIGYSRDLFDEETIRRMARHYEKVVEEVVRDAEQTIREIELLSGSEREQILLKWNQTARAYPEDRSIQELFEEQVERMPETVAVAFGDQRLTYRELNARANRMARALVEHGVGPESLVAVLAERGTGFLITMLGVFKAGGAYIPLDPRHPAQRIGQAVSLSGAAVVVTDSECDALAAESIAGLSIGNLPAKLVFEVLLEKDLQTENLGRRLAPERLAYVIYTSGSTGVPKGAMVEQRGMLNHLFAKVRDLGLEEKDVVAQTASQCFDISVWQFLAALLVGGQVQIFADETTHDLTRLLDQIEEREVTILEIVPSMMRMMLSEAGSRKVKPDLAMLRWLIPTGEALPPDLCREWFRLYPGIPLLNAYGPTECSDDVTHCPIEYPLSETAVRSPIGRPIANTQIYVLNGELKPQPIGIVGELYVGGAGIGRGYLNEAGKTAETFAPAPYGMESGARAYRSGDLARYLSDGKLEYLGRVDHQVKIRGFRIELGEIETRLSCHPEVREAVVVAREEGEGGKRLVAYYTGEDVGAEALRAHLATALPDYMAPAAYVHLERLPLTPNGKLDRRALPAPDVKRAEERDGYLAPRTPVEEIVVGIFEEVLRLNRVGREDNFFDLGGHSLLATQVISRIRNTFRVEIGLRTIFEEQTAEGLASKIEEAMRAGEKDEAPPLVRTSREGQLPLSFAQERMWFIDQLNPGSAVYNIPGAFRLEGELDVLALESVINEIVRRHEALRTRFEVEKGAPAQVIDEWEPRRLEVEDLSGMAREMREEEVNRIAREEARTGFDLSKGPLLRVKVLKLDDEDHVVLYTMHHIISDGWSIDILIREVEALYQAYSRGEESPLAELDVQYVDYAMWQREYLAGGLLEKDVAYWKEQLKGASVLKLPTDYPRPAAPSYRGGRERVNIGKEVHEGLRRLSQQEGATLFMTLMAGFKVVLMRYSGDEEVSVGTAIANRTRKEVEGMIGFFVNTLVMRTQMGGNPSFRELVRREREVALGAYGRQEAPFEKLVEEINPDRDLSRSPLFQVMMVLQNIGREALDIKGLKLSELGEGSGTAKFDLLMMLTEGSEGIWGSLDYSQDLYDGETVSKMARRYEQVMAEVVRDGEQRIREIELMSGSEREQILVEWNETAAEYPRDWSIQGLFEALVKEKPERVAVVDQEVEMSYGELNRRANQLGNYLRRLGVGPEGLVGICMERSVEMIVGLLGIVKAGGAYLPLDPAYPAERLRYMVEDGRPVALLTQERWLGRLPNFCGETVCLDRDWRLMECESEENLELRVRWENQAYVIYTSGSSGQPKGVMGLHGGAINRFAWMWKTYPFTSEEICCQKTSLNFLDSLWEIFGPLLQGIRTVIVGDEAIKEVSGLVSILESEQVSRIVVVPSLLRALLDRLDDVPGGLDRLKYCTSSGEALTPAVSEAFSQRLPETRLLNLYGSSEVSADVSWHEVSGSEKEWEAPLGRPITNTQIYLLDDRLQPAPVGVAAELYVGGRGLGRGYLNQSDLTAEKFIPNPFRGVGGERLYKTGDLARYLGDGKIEFRGRIDRQVKIRGFRIELGEIETQLRSHPGVRECVVMGDQDGVEMGLVAYVVCEGEKAASISELRGHLKERAPEYMVPGRFVRLEEMPLTPSGKVNRQALRASEVKALETREGYLTPQTPVEEIVVGIYEEVLKLDRVGRTEDFFEIGGHSLLVTRVVSRVRKALGVEIGVKDIFNNATAEGLAGMIEEAIRRGKIDEAPALVRIERGGKPPLSFAQQRLWFIEQLEPGNAAYNIPGAVRLEGKLNLDALERSLNEIIRRHEVLRTRIEVEEGEPAQVIDEWEPRRLEAEDLTSVPPEEREEEVRRRMREEARTGFDLSAGPLLRVKVLKLGEEEHVALYTMHHIVSDAWSMVVLMREVGALYDAINEGRASPLPELKIQYADYAYWQRSYLKGAVLEKHLQYWKKQLGGKLPVLELPGDRPRPSVPSYQGAAKSILLPAELSESLRVLSRREGVTLFMVLLAAFKTLLYKYTAQEDVIVGVSWLNRDRVEIEPLIGFFVNMLPIRTDLSGNPRFSELLMRVKDVALGAYTHQEAPFEKLVEEIRPERKLRQTPLYNVVFGLQNEHKKGKEEEVRLNGLKISQVGIGRQSAKVDLMLWITEQQEALEAGWVYSADLFEGETIVRMHDHFETLLLSIVARPDAPLDELEILSEAEKSRQAISRAARKESNYSRFKSVKPRMIPLSEGKK